MTEQRIAEIRDAVNAIREVSSADMISISPRVAKRIIGYLDELLNAVRPTSRLRQIDEPS